MWRGDATGSHDQQGVRILGVPIGSAAFVRRQLEEKSAEHETLFHRMPLMDNTQACWLLLLLCAATRANFWLRVRQKRAVCRASRHHRTILGSERAPDSTKAISQLPFSQGGLGLTSAGEVESGSTQVQLGRLHPHDQTTSPFSGRHFDHRHPPWSSALRWRNQGWRSHRGGRWLIHLFRWRMVRNPQNRRLVGSIARHDVWKSNTSGCSCGPLSQTLSAH